MSAQPRTIVIVLQRARWDEVVDGLKVAALSLDGPGWCWGHTVPEGQDMCDACARNVERANSYGYDDLAREIECKVKGRRGLIALAYPIDSWKLIAAGQAEGAEYFGCDLLEDKAITKAWLNLGARIIRHIKRTPARPARAPRRPRGTRR